MRNFNIFTGIWCFAWIKIICFLGVVYAGAKAYWFIKEAATDSPVLLGAIAVGVIALLIIVVKIKKAIR